MIDSYKGKHRPVFNNIWGQNSICGWFIMREKFGRLENYGHSSAAAQMTNMLIISGRGRYGEVYLARLRERADEGIVMIKSVDDDDDNDNNYQHDVDMFTKCQHDNIVSIISLSTKPRNIILQYTDNVSTGLSLLS